jgi:hypothetical protein
MAIVLALGFIVLAAFAIRWRALTPIERWWTVLISSDAFVIFLIPTTPATSPRRLIADRALEIAVAACVVLMLGGVVLVWARWREGQSARDLLPAFVVGSVPLLAIGLISLLWSVG